MSIKRLNFNTWWKERSKKIERVRKVRFVTNLTQKLEAINQETNEGRLRHLVYHISPEIREMTCTSGGWGNSSVEIDMSDHFTINAYDHWLRDALKDAAEQVVNRLLDKHGIPNLGDLT
jgi:hypothetical protein